LLIYWSERFIILGCCVYLCDVYVYILSIFKADHCWIIKTVSEVTLLLLIIILFTVNQNKRVLSQCTCFLITVVSGRHTFDRITGRARFLIFSCIMLLAMRMHGRTTGL